MDSCFTNHNSSYPHFKICSTYINWFSLKILLVYFWFHRLQSIITFLPDFPHQGSETHKLNTTPVHYILLLCKSPYTYKVYYTCLSPWGLPQSFSHQNIKVAKWPWYHDNLFYLCCPFWKWLNSYNTYNLLSKIEVCILVIIV